MGAVKELIPSVATVYHFNVSLLLPDTVALKATEGAFWQNVTGLAVGAAGNAVTVTAIFTRGLSQLFTVWVT